MVRLGLCRIDIHCDQINLNQNSEQLVDEGTKNHHYVQSAKVEKNITDYTKAFELATGTKSGDYELRFDRKRKFATVKKTDGGVYYVAKFSDLIQDVKDPFTDGPEHVPPTLPGEVTEELYFTTEFLSSLMAAVEERQYTAVSAVCSASAITANPETTFWSCLETVDAGRLYGKAIDFTIKCYPPGNLLRDIACRYIEQGEHYLNQVQDGIFEIVVFNEDTDNQGPFYVYSVDALT